MNVLKRAVGKVVMFLVMIWVGIVAAMKVWREYNDWEPTKEGNLGLAILLTLFLVAITMLMVYLAVAK